MLLSPVRRKGTLTAAVFVSSLITACGVEPAFLRAGDRTPPAQQAHPIWVDFDPVSRPNQTADIDDVLALRLLQNAGPKIAGVSTTAGNGDADDTYRSARAEFGRLSIHRGGPSSDCDSAAIAALSTVLTEQRLTILALGPLTNLAILLTCRPELAGRIVRIIAIAGRLPGERLELGKSGEGQLRDLNYETDRRAFRTVLQSGVPLSLAPFAAGNAIRLRYGDLSDLPPHLRDRAWSWALILWFAGGGGTLPAFDPAAAGLLLWPDLYRCNAVSVEAEHNLVLRPVVSPEESRIRRCVPSKPDLLHRAIRRWLF